MLNSHERFMREAIKLARLAKGKTYPNPLVGAVVVNNGKIISKGYHKKSGAPHAEALALARGAGKTEGASLYVTLEPCAHRGKTPPCVDAITKSGIKKVYTSMKDPNPLVNGKGIKALRDNNITVKVGIESNKAKKLNSEYIKRMRSVKE